VPDDDRFKPKDHAEATALFRSEVIGALARRELQRGEMRAALRELATQRFRPPGYQHTRTFSVPTLERWFSAAASVMRSSPRRCSIDRHRQEALLSRRSA
jgi:hypothetical protein